MAADAEFPADRAHLASVTRSMPRCFACGWDGPPLMRAEAEAMVAGHNLLHHPELLTGGGS